MANTITVELDLDTLAAQGKLKGFAVKAKKEGAKAATGFGANFKKDLDSKLTSLSKVFTPLNMGLAATAASFAIVAKNAAVAVGEMRVFGRSVANVNSILPANAKLTKDSTNALNDFAASLGTSNAKQADAFYSIVSAGVKGTTKQLQTLKVANEAAIAGLVDIDTSSKLLVSSVNSYATSGLTAATASDVLFVAVREGQTTFGELASALGNVTPIAAAAGLKFEELAGAIAGITKAGIKTDVAVTGMKALLSSLIKVTPEAAKEAKRLGLEFSTTALRAKGFVGFMKDLAEKTKGNEVALGKLFPNIRALSPILQVVNGDFADFTRIQGEVKDSLGATGLAADEIKKSLDFKLTQASANFSILRQELVASFIPALGDVASSISRYITLNRDSASETSKLQAKIGNMKVELEGFTTTMNSQGLPALKEWTSQSSTAQRGVFALTKRIREMQAEIQGIANQKMFDESTFGQIVNAKAELFELENRLNNVGNALVNIEGKSQFELLGDITAKKDEIALLNAELIQTTTVVDALPETTEKVKTSMFSLASSFGDLIRSFKVGFSDLATDPVKSMKKIEGTAKQLGAVFKQSVAGAISGGVKNIINSIGKGEDAFANFGSFMLKTIGDMAVKLGETLIFAGLGIESLKALGGSAAIAAGIGLVAIGTILSNAGGGGESSSSSSGGGGGSIGAPVEDFTDSDSIEERQTTTVVNLNVQGVVSGDKSEVASFIQDTLNEANEKNGIIQLNTRTA